MKEGNLCRWHPPVEREGAEDCVYLASFRPELNEHKQAHIVFETLLQQLTHTFLTASELGGTEKRPAPEGNSKAGGTGVWECACDMQRMWSEATRMSANRPVTVHSTGNPDYSAPLWSRNCMVHSQTHDWLH